MTEDTFWKDIVVPFQEEDETYEFSSLFQISKYFAKSTGIIAYLGEQAEKLNLEEKSLEEKLMEVEEEFRQLRRKINAKHYKSITKSASSELQEAFLWTKAEEEGKLQEYQQLESDINLLKKHIFKKRKEIDKLKYRIKMLEMAQRAGTEHLNFEKLIMRITSNEQR